MTSAMDDRRSRANNGSASETPDALSYLARPTDPQQFTAPNDQQSLVAQVRRGYDQVRNVRLSLDRFLETAHALVDESVPSDSTGIEMDRFRGKRELFVALLSIGATDSNRFNQTLGLIRALANGAIAPAEAATNLKSLRPLEGRSITEIGGLAMSRLAEALGARVTAVDAGFNESIAEIEAKGTPVIYPDQLVTLDNYRQFIADKSDLSVSSWLLTPGSGAEFIAKPSSGSNRTIDAVTELLAVFANVTKLGGFSVHDHAMLVCRDLFPFFGLTLVVDIFPAVSQLPSGFIVQRTEPNLAVSEHGLPLGQRTIVYDRTESVFKFRS